MLTVPLGFILGTLAEAAEMERFFPLGSWCLLRNWGLDGWGMDGGLGGG